MKPAQIAVICVAAVAAIGLAVVVRKMGNSPQSSPQIAQVQVEPVAQVLVAARNLEPGQRLSDADLNWKAWPLKDVNPLFITDGTAPAAPTPVSTSAVEGAAAQVASAAAKVLTTGAKQDYIGAVVREPILAGEPLVNRKIVRAGDGGYMAAFLEPGMRAMAMRVSVETAAGGFILPGDRVDVILTREVKGTGPDGSATSRHVASTIMHNLKVLAIDQSTRAGEEEKSVIGATATVAVTGSDAETLALARSEGELSLVLRSYADTAGPSGRIPGALRSGPAPGLGASSGGRAAHSVTIYREGQPQVVAIS